MTAGFGVGVVWLTWALGRRLWKDEKVGILGAVFVAVNYRQVLNSHFGLPDIYNAFFLLLAILAVVKWWEEQTVESYFWVGVTQVLYISTKFQWFGLVPLLGGVIVLVARQKRWRDRLKWVFQRKMWLMIAVMVFAGLVLNVVHLWHIREVTEKVWYSAMKYRMGSNILSGFSFSYLYHIGIGPVMSWWVVLGIILGLVFCLRRMIWLVSVTVPFFWMMAYYTGGGFYTRNWVTITPVLLISGAVGISFVGQWLAARSKVLSVGFLVIIVGLVVFESLKNAVVVPIWYSRPWNRILVENWLERNLPNRATVLAYGEEKLPEKDLQVVRVKNPSDYFLSEMQDKGVEWVVVNLDRINLGVYWWMGQDWGFRFWEKPTEIMRKSVVGRMVDELSKYEVFEALKPWQVPETSYLVVKVPEKVSLEGGGLVYRGGFDGQEGWMKENDGLGSVDGLSWDEEKGHLKKGSLAIGGISGGVYTQQWVSQWFPVEVGQWYKVRGWLASLKSLEWEKRDGVLGAEFLGGDGRVLGVSLASRIWGATEWQRRELVAEPPEGSKFLRLFFQVEDPAVNALWLDDVEVLKGEVTVEEVRGVYIQSGYLSEEHLFLNSNGGM